MKKKFGDILREQRIKKGLTQEELAKIFNTGKASISHYESNRRLPDANTIKKYADFFDITLDEMMGESKSYFLNKAVDLTLLEVIQDINNESDEERKEAASTITSHLVNRLIDEGIINPHKPIDDDTMELIKNAIFMDAKLKDNIKKDEKR